ncbi:kinase-like domain, phloem protein 2-like protein [Tanacetum coccineum]
MEMDNSNWRPTQGVSGGPVGDPSMESGDWRAQLQADSRQRIVNKIMETLKRHLPFCGHEGLQELKKIAVRFEEKIYTAATSQSDYLRKISLKMLTLETRSQNFMPDPMQANNGFNPVDPASLDSTDQTRSANGGDWQEEVYQKIKAMKDLFDEHGNMMFSPGDFAHLKIPLENIISATDNFKKKNLIQKADSGNAYAGELLWSGELTEIYARRLNKERDDEIVQQFWMEISMLSSLKHKNLVSLSLDVADMGAKIGDISIAQALSYIHYDESRDFSVIHLNIDSESIHLNNDWEPKLSGFIRSMKIKASERHNSFNTDKVWSTDGYIDPTYIKTKSANHKLDIYSFGIVMFELLCGNKYLAPLVLTHYRDEKLNEIIDWDLWKQMDSHSLDVFAKTAYECLNDERSQRPNIGEIVPRLEKALELKLEHQNAGHSDVKKNGKWPCIYAVGSQEYQMVCTRLDIASADVSMLAKFDRRLQTYAAKEAIWLKRLAIESGLELKIVASIATGALSKAIPSPRFQHRLNLLSIGIG